MIKLPIEIAHSNVHFAFRGHLQGWFRLLVISEGCPLALRNAMPDNPADRTSGRLRSVWFNRLKPAYHWALSEILPDFGHPVGQLIDNLNESSPASVPALKTGFQPGSRLQLAWRSYGNAGLRSRVKRQLDRRAADICTAILRGSADAVADIIAPIVLECEGYLIES